MIYYRGSILRAPTLHLSGGISRVRGSLGLFVIMIQRISVRLLLEHKGKPLIVRRADGRHSLIGKYELPGGRVHAGEQPQDAINRYAREDLGVDEKIKIDLADAFTYIDADDRGIQYAVIVYRAKVSDIKRVVSLSRHYDKFVWYRSGRPDPKRLTELAQIILGAEQPIALDNSGEGKVSFSVPTVYTDGGSRGNPGPSAAGYVLIDDSGRLVDQGGEYLGVTTNNQAEYHGVRIGLESAIKHGWRNIEVKVDSMLVVNQLNGIYKIKNRELWPIYERIKELIGEFEKVKFLHIPREMNQLADGMVNKTLDSQKRSEYNK